MDKEIKEKIEFEIENIRNIARTSTGFQDFSIALYQGILACYKAAGDEKKYTACMNLSEALKEFFRKVSEFDVKLCVELAPYEFNIVGGGMVSDYDKTLEEDLIQGQAIYLGAYYSKHNMIHIPAHFDVVDRFLTGKVEFYGIDQKYAYENYFGVVFSTYLHECIHAYLFGIGANRFSGVTEIATFTTVLSSTYKMNDLRFMKGRVGSGANANWQEIIAHLISNRDYYELIIRNNYQFEISKILTRVIRDDKSLEMLVSVINQYSRYLFESNKDVCFYVPDYTNKEQFLSRQYFKQYENHILGIEHAIDMTGYKSFRTRKYPEDLSLSDVIERIAVPEIDFAQFDNIARLDTMADDNELDEIKNQLAASIEKKKTKTVEEEEDLPPLISFRESVEKYNLQSKMESAKTGEHSPWLTRLELEAYLYCNPQFNKDMWIEASQHSEDEILKGFGKLKLNKGFENECEIEVPLVIFDGETNHYHAQFCDGDLYRKVENLKDNHDKIVQQRGEEYYNSMIAGFDKLKNIDISFDNPDYTKRPFVVPSSLFAQEFFIDTYENDNRSQKTSIMLVDAFSNCVGSTWFKSARYNGIQAHVIQKVLRGQRIVEQPHQLRYGQKKKDLTPKQRQANDEADMNNSIEFDQAWEMCCRAFSDFIKECIDPLSKERLTKQLFDLNNKFTFTDIEKIPVGFTHSRYFKRTRLRLTDTQRNAVAWLNVIGCGLLGYEMGIGKTLSALMAIRNKFDTGKANKALVIVPAQVYEKWMKDTANHTENIKDAKTGAITKIDMKGSLPDINIVGLHNLNNKALMSLKEFTADELKLIKGAEEGFDKFQEIVEEKFSRYFEKEIIKEEGTEKPEPQEGESKSELSSPDIDLFGEKTKKSLFKFSKDINLETISEELNVLIKDLDINIFKVFRLTNPSSINCHDILKVIRYDYDSDKGLPLNIQGVYEGIGLKGKWSKIKNFATDIPGYIHLSAILNAVYNSYEELESSYIATLGKLRQFPNKTIFFANYKTFEKFGYKDETLALFKDKILQILEGIADDEKGYNQELTAKLWSKIAKILDTSDFGSKLYFEDFGIDYLCVDEAHALKSLMTKITKGKEEKTELKYKGNTGMHKDIGGGDISLRALVGFIMTMYVQENNGGTNTCLLTGTPFTNSPLEIYSMLSITNHSYLKSIGYDTVKKFIDDFIKVKAQLSVSIQGTVTIKNEPIGFYNLNLLKRIIYRVIDFKTGEEAKTKRPCKIVLPLKEKTTLRDCHATNSFHTIKPINTIIKPTDDQQLIIDAIQTYLLSQIDSQSVDKIFRDYIRNKGNEYIRQVMYGGTQMTEEEIGAYEAKVERLAEAIHENFNLVETRKGKEVVPRIHAGIAILKSLAALRNASISPYMFVNFVENFANINNIETKDVIGTSSKLLYVLSCIKQANAHNDALGLPRKSYVIYTNLGKQKGKNSPIVLVNRLQEYMISEDSGFGYKKNNVIDTEDISKTVIKDGKSETVVKTKTRKFSEVELLVGGGTDKRPAILRQFNRGDIKVIITTAKEAVDLQGNTIGLFNISVDWNPTEAKQIEGRVWRQGNRNAYIIVDYPLTANSSDLAIYQKLQDKTRRLKELWDKQNVKSQFDVEEFDPESLKLAMINRVDKLAPFLYMDEIARVKLDLRILQARRAEDGQVIKDFQEWQSKEYQTRFALHLYTRLPVALQRQADRKEIINDLQNTHEALVANQQEIETRTGELKREKFYQIEADNNAKKQAIEDEINQKKAVLSELKMQIAELVTSDQMDKVPAVKAQIQGLTKEIEILEKTKIEQVAKIDKEIETIQLFIDKQVEEELKEQVAEVKKFTKEIEKLKEKLDKIDSEPIFSVESPERIKELTINELGNIDKGNYFVKGEKGNMVYIHKDMDLSHIDWINVATVYDLMEGLDRVSEAYMRSNSTLRVPLESYYKWEGTSTINIDDIQEECKIFAPEDYVKCMPEFMQAISSHGGSRMRTEYLIDMITKSVFKNKNFSHYYLWEINFTRRRILRSIMNYNSTVENQDPEQYLANLDAKISELIEKTGGTSITKISDEVIERYIDKAAEVIQSRNKEYGNYTALVDAYASLNELMNLESPYLKFESTGKTNPNLPAVEIRPKGNIEGSELTATLLHGEETSEDDEETIDVDALIE